MVFGKLFIPALLCMMVALAGCSENAKAPNNSGNQPTAAASEKNDQPAYGDMIIRGSIGDASVLLPVLVSDSASGEITGLIYNGLVKYDKDINLVGDLADKWEIFQDKLAENKLRIRFYLRKDVKWQDGKPFTTKDVDYTYRLIVDPKTPTAYATDFLRVKELRVLDDYTVEAVYEEAYAPALGSWGQAMHPAHLLEGQDVTKSPLKRSPVGTGPYRFAEWKIQDRIILNSNHDYFEGRPYIDRVMTRVIPDLATMFLELKAGRLDWTGLTPLQYRRQTDTQWFKENFVKYKYVGFNYVYLGYNLKDPKFQDKKVRQALTTAINRESIIEGVLLGLGQPAYTPYNPDTFWYNPNVKKFPYDPEKAKQMLEKAGWKDTDGDGILDKDGTPFRFTIITNQGNDQRKYAATIIQRDLRRVGIDVSIRVIEWAAFIKNFINKRNFEACLLGWNIGIDPNQIDIWNSKKTGESQLNFISYDNPEVDQLLEDGVSTYDREERKKYYDRFQEIVAEDQPYTFLFVPESLPILSARFRGIQPAPAGISYNFREWYVPKQLQKHQIQP